MWPFRFGYIVYEHYGPCKAEFANPGNIVYIQNDKCKHNDSMFTVCSVRLPNMVIQMKLQTM